MVAVLHGSEIWVAYWMVSGGIDHSNLSNYWGYGAIMVVVAIIIIIANGTKDLSRKWGKVVHPSR